MDRWEEEYLSIIERQKERQANVARKPATGRIQKGWKEIVREDGTKWYVPDEAVLSRQERRMKRKERLYQRCSQRKGGCLFAVLKRLIVLLLICLLIVVGLFNVKLGEKIDIDIPWKLSSVRSSAPVRNTYVNGLGLHKMANTLWDIRDRQTSTLNAYMTGGGFSLDEISAWQDRIVDDLIVIDNLKYDESYSNVVDGYMRLLNVLQDFINYVLMGDRERAAEAWTEYTELLPALNYMFVEALEANGVEYTIDENSMSFRYRLY